MNKLPKPGEAGETSESPEDNQGLILDFAQQIASMENNIWHLPEGDGVKKRIERAIKKMRATFKSLGYDMPKLLGTEVSDNQILEINADYPSVETIVLGSIDGSVNDDVNVETGRLIREAGYTAHLKSDSEIYSGGVDLFCSGLNFY